MIRKTLLFVAPAVLGLWAGCSGGTDVDEGNLVGGRQADASDFPSTLTVRNNCTVSKVGTRHILTAAHCVDDHRAADGVSQRFGPGWTIQLGSSVDTTDGDLVTVEIERTAIHPVWVDLSRRDNGNVLIDEHPPDVAVIILTEDSAQAIADVPIASVDVSPVVDGDRLWIMGYGCENGVDNANRYPEGGPRLKIQETEALNQSVLEHEGTFIPTRQNPIVHGRYVITPGKAYSNSQASLCPGDSGSRRPVPASYGARSPGRSRAPSCRSNCSVVSASWAAPRRPRWCRLAGGLVRRTSC